MGGIKRITQTAKQHLGLKITEGNPALPQNVLEKISKKHFSSAEEEDVFCHLLFVLDWNLMKCAESVIDAKVTHISFREDALIFECAKSKGNQMGDEFGPWHVYANLSVPWICPVFAFAR